MKRRLLLCFLTGLLLSACGSRLPDDRPDDFRVGYSLDGGMMPYGQHLSVSADAGSYRLFDEGLTVEVLFTVPAEKLDEVYQRLRENRVDRIQTYEEEVYDRGGTSLDIRADGQSYDINDSGMSFVRANWSAAFDAGTAAILTLIAPEGDPNARWTTIEWEDSLSFGGYSIRVEPGANFAGINLREPGAHSIIIITQGTDTLSITAIDDNLDREVTREMDLTQYSTYHIKHNGQQFVMEPLP